MPRRNRNAHAFRLDADELAVQADQLTAELAANSGAVLVIDEMQLFYPDGAAARTALRNYITNFIHEHPGCQISLTDAKVVTSNGRN